LKHEIVLRITLVCNDIGSTVVSLLDFVEKLIHRFDGTKETSACDLNSGASVEQFRSIVRKRRQFGLAFDDSAARIGHG
jgi:hypothetical protein